MCDNLTEGLWSHCAGLNVTGGIFEKTDRRKLSMFRVAGTRTGVDIITETVDNQGFLSASHAVCKMKKEGVAGIYVPPTVSTAQYIASECKAMDVPFITDLVNVYLQPDDLNKVNIIIQTINLVRFGVDCDWKVEVVGIVGLMTIHFGKQTVFSFSHTEGKCIEY